MRGGMPGHICVLTFRLYLVSWIFVFLGSYGPSSSGHHSQAGRGQSWAPSVKKSLVWSDPKAQAQLLLDNTKAFQGGFFSVGFEFLVPCSNSSGCGAAKRGAEPPKAENRRSSFTCPS